MSPLCHVTINDDDDASQAVELTPLATESNISVRSADEYRSNKSERDGLYLLEKQVGIQLMK
jgi:hypothetical protein